jgi:hypothetical protein
MQNNIPLPVVLQFVRKKQFLAQSDTVVTKWQSQCYKAHSVFILFLSVCKRYQRPVCCLLHGLKYKYFLNDDKLAFAYTTFLTLLFATFIGTTRKNTGVTEKAAVA